MMKVLFTILFSLCSFSLIASCSSCEQKKEHMQETTAVTEKKEVKSCICTKEFQPVCGEDKMTYSNACSANCAEVKIAHNGSCIETMGKK